MNIHIKNSKFDSIKYKSFKFAFKTTIPILLGFLFLGIAYGIYMHQLGFNPLYPIIMSFSIFGGSMEFVAAGLLLNPFDPIKVFFLTIIINARHLFYGISMLEKYNIRGIKKIYLIFGMCDESFSINYSITPPKGISSSWFMFFVTLLNHVYWVLGATLGSIFSEFITIDIKGIEFVMTSLFLILFLDQWMIEKSHFNTLAGLISSLFCLIIFGSKNFILPSMILILVIVSFNNKNREET